MGNGGLLLVFKRLSNKAATFSPITFVCSVRDGVCKYWYMYIFFLSLNNICLSYCLRYVRSCMKDWYMFIFYIFFIFLIHVVLGLNACPCRFLYMYISVVSEGLMDD